MCDFLFLLSEDAVCIGKVRCTFWSLGESLKPGGSVNSWVVFAFCYSLFLKPASTTNTKFSKSHFFFANIGVSMTFLFSFYFLVFTFYVSVWKVVPTLTSKSVEIYLSMAGAKQLGDTMFILVSARAVSPAGVCSRHCIALHCVLAEGRYKQGGRGGGASRSLRYD
jgi:hypothetical protein